MTTTTEYARGVIAITDLARQINPNIGSYKEHFIIENFGFIVQLSNGGIKIPRELAQEYELQPWNVAKNSIKAVAESYWKS
jgi:hypothetical protein